MAKIINLYDVSDTCIWDLIYDCLIKKDKGENVTIDDLSNAITDYLYNDVPSVTIDECDYELMQTLFKSDVWDFMKYRKQKDKIEQGK